MPGDLLNLSCRVVQLLSNRRCCLRGFGTTCHRGKTLLHRGYRTSQGMKERLIISIMDRRKELGVIEICCELTSFGKELRLRPDEPNCTLSKRPERVENACCVRDGMTGRPNFQSS